MSAITIIGECHEGQPPANMAYVTDTDGTPLTQSDVSSISYQVTERDTGVVVLSATSLTVSAVIFNELQTPAIWTVDETGYNFRHDAPGTTVPQGGRWYRFEYTLTLSGGGTRLIPFEIYSKSKQTP